MVESNFPSLSSGKYSKDAKRPKLGKKLVNQDAISSQQSLIEHPAIAINILPFLDVWDVLSFGSCSKSLHGICESEETWKQLLKQRWSNHHEGESPLGDEGWKGLYMKKHMTSCTAISTCLGKFEEYMGSQLDAKVFFFGIDLVKNLDITYEDVYFSFFRIEKNVLIILLGLYYAFFCWDVSVEDLKKDLVASGVAEKKVSMRWCLPVSNCYGFYMKEEKHMQVFSLEEIVENEMSFFYVLRCTAEKAHFARRKGEVADVVVTAS